MSLQASKVGAKRSTCIYTSLIYMYVSYLSLGSTITSVAYIHIHVVKDAPAWPGISRTLAIEMWF